MCIRDSTYTFANALNGMFLPKVSRIVNDKGDVVPLMIRVGRIQIYIIGLIVVGVICFGQEFIQLWVGKEFSESYLCAVLIILPSLFHLPQTIGSETIYAKNQVKNLAIVFIIMAICNLLGAVILSQPFGAIGICASVFIAYLTRTIGMDYVLYKKLGIDVFKFFRNTFVTLAFPMIMCISLGFIIEYYVGIGGWIGFVSK